MYCFCTFFLNVYNNSVAITPSFSTGVGLTPKGANRAWGVVNTPWAVITTGVKCGRGCYSNTPFFTVWTQTVAHQQQMTLLHFLATWKKSFRFSSSCSAVSRAYVCTYMNNTRSTKTYSKCMHAVYTVHSLKTTKSKPSELCNHNTSTHQYTYVPRQYISYINH